MTFVSGDTGSLFRLTCRDNDTKAVIPLTGATVTLRWLDANDALVSKLMTIVDAVNGIVSYQFLAGELFATKMKFEVRITDSGGQLLHSIDLLREDVRAVLS